MRERRRLERMRGDGTVGTHGLWRARTAALGLHLDQEQDFDCYLSD